ncbi:MAG: S1 RNA-binding domain-containing protein [Rubripirellula sp.]
MSVDFEAIAQRGRCDVSSLRLALPLLEQGYTPPFLARYRRDELGGLDESSLWALSTALKNEQQIAKRRDELHEVWEQTSLRDPAIGQAIKKSNSLRMLARLGRRLKAESHDQVSDATRLAVRVLNPQKGDGSDFAAIATKVDGIEDAEAAVAGLDQALAKRLAGDPRVVGAAVRWLVKNARVHVASISDPHTPQEEGKQKSSSKKKASKTGDKAASSDSEPKPESTADANDVAAVDSGSDTAAVEAVTTESGTSATPVADSGAPALEATATEPAATEPAATEPAATEPAATEPAATEPAATEPAAETPSVETPSAESAGSEPQSSGDASATASVSPEEASSGNEPATTDAAADSAQAAQPSGKAASGKAPKSEPKPAKKQKKVSPRQRRRRWLVGVLKPLSGKRFACDKLSSFQVVMLGRALRSQVAQCAFEYDATKLVAELQRTASGINRHVEQKLRDIVLANEADIREAAETAWWDDLHERASARLVTITADHLRRHVNRGAVEAKVVLSVDAVGPRTAATSIVSSDGRILHNEDLPCQLSAASRSQAVARIGELIHTYHVDLLVISNGPSRRATMIALGDLIGQSPEASVRWTLADRSGADVYASSSVADEEMRTTPRRFRAAAWLAFSVLQPAQALAKVDPLKLRLSSFQRELSDEAMLGSLEDVIVSGASRGGVDVNSAPVSWLQRLPGVQEGVAKAIDRARRNSLFPSRQAIVDLEEWGESTHSRQAIPFLRVFGSDEALDGTLLHPDDYPLAKTLASALGIELPPEVPPGYEPPDFTVESEPKTPQLAETPAEPEKTAVEDFTSAGESSPEFAVESATAAESTETEGDSAVEAGDQPPAEAGTPEPASEPVTAASDDTVEKTAEVTESPSGESPDTESPTAESSDSESSDAESPSAQSSDAGESKDASTAESPEDKPAVEVAERVRHPRPEKAKIDKCIKEWQIGNQRTQQLVQWLCDPFGDSDSTGSPPAVLSTMPSIKALKPGDTVIGVVVGVMPFGVFVELAPDCSGLVHVSRVSDSYVEDLHEAVQVGDVVTAWVTGIDEKRRRVALSAVSPEREAELEETRRQRDDRSRGQGRRGGDRRSNGPARGTADARGGASRGGDARGGKPSGAGGRGRDQGRGREGGRSRDGGRGRSRDGRGGGRRDKKPESYRVVGKKESKPISDAMKGGEEPLRSFGDLMQFFDHSKEPAEAPKSKNKKSDVPKSDSASESQKPESQKPESDQPESSVPETPTSGPSSSETPPSDASKPAPSDAKPSPADKPEATGEPTATVASEGDSTSKAKDQSGPDSSSPADAPTS